MRILPLLCTSSLLAFSSGFVFAQETPLAKVPDGFKVELLLQAPDIEAPTALTVAPNGDVYYGEDPMDMSGPPTKNIDKIWMLKGGDPKKKVLIADQMWAVMGLEFVHNKLYVVHPPHVTVFTLDKEGKPTKREEIFDDLGPKVAGAPSFNDHVPSGIRMGMDGWLYVSIGDKGIPKMSRIPIPLRNTEQGKVIEKWGSVHVAEGRWRHVKEGHHISLEGGGVIRFRPDGTQLEVFASGTRNHLDVPMDEHDRIFVRDNTDDGLGWNTRLMYLPQGAFMGYPWAYKKHPEECLPAITEFGGGSPCGGWVYCDDGLPETYRGRIFHCEWGQGKIGAVKVKPKGAGFEFVDQIDFMLPGELKDFRPFSLRPTEDGRGFYVTDWAFNGWSDKTKAGRLWKVTYTKDDVKPKPRGKDDDTVSKLIEALNHPAHSERLRAQRVLRANEEYRTVVISLIRDDKLTPLALRHAIWLVDGYREQTFFRLMNHLDDGVRREILRAVQRLPIPELNIEADNPEGGILGILKYLHHAAVNSPDGYIRLQATLAFLSYHHKQHLRKHLLKEEDPFVRQALVRVIRDETRYWNSFTYDETPENMAGLLSGEDLLKSDPSSVYLQTLTDHYDPEATKILIHLANQTKASTRKSALEILARNAKDRPLYTGTWWGTQPASQKPPTRSIVWESTPMIRDTLVKALGDSDPGVRKVAVAGLIELRDPETLKPLVTRLESEKNSDTKADLIRAISGLKIAEASAVLTNELNDEKNSETIRIEAIKGLEILQIQKATDSLIFTALDSKPTTIQARAIEALGNLKAKETEPVFIKAIKSESPLVRKTAIQAIAKINDKKLGIRVLPLLADPDKAVMIAAIQTLGTLQIKDAIPFLLPLLAPEETQFDTILALTKMPDIQAVSAYLTGLTSKNTDLRNASRNALLAIREPAAKVLEEFAKRKEIRSELVPQLREIYGAFQPIPSWHLIGPFPKDNKPYPPEKEQRFDATYKSEGKDIGWKKDQKGDPKNSGMINLEALFSPNQSRVAYGYAEVESSEPRDATLAIGSDDTIIVWLNGKKVHDFNGSRGWGPNQDRVQVRLDKGKNQLLIKCGNDGGPWAFSVGVSSETSHYSFLKGGTQKLDLEAFRKFARTNKGDSKKGEKLFLDQKGLACVKCHAVNGSGGSVGPDMSGIALRYNKEDLMTSILEPSKNIANGYETVRIIDLDGKVTQGVFKGETEEAVTLADENGKTISIAKKDIESRRTSPVSLMPNGLNEGMSLQDFADIIAYLESRREEKKK